MEIVTLLTVENLIVNLAQTLIHFCWQAALIALILKVALLFSDKQSLHFRYYSSVLALLGCIIAPIYTISILWQDASSMFIVTDIQSANTDVLTNASIGINTISAENGILQSILSFFDMRFIVAFWGVGVCTMLLKLIYDLRKTFRLTRVGVAPVEKSLEQLVLKLSSRLGIKRTVSIFKSTLVNVPVVIGWIKPTVLLPIAITVGLDKRQLELIVAHELAHVKRLDFLINLIQGLLQAFFFFHPCVYWINKMVREEREYICDSMALTSVNHVSSARLDLAKALLKIEELKEGNLSLAVAASDGHLKNRISRIVFNERMRMPSTEGILIAIIGLVISFTSIAVSVEFSNQFEGKQYDNQIASDFHENNTDIVEDVVTFNVNTKLRPRVAPEFVGTNETKNSSLKNKTNNKFSRLSPRKLKLAKQSKALNKALIGSKKLIDNLKTSDDSNNRQPIINVISEKKLKFNSQNLSSKLLNSDALNTLKTSELEFEFLVDNVAASRDRLSDRKPRKFVFEKQKKRRKLALLDASKEEFKQPKAISTPYPVYPAEAYSGKLSGMIKVDFTINEKGRVVSPRFSEGTSWLFAREIRSKLMRWRYKPALKNGIKVAFQSSVFFEFELPPEKPLVKHQVGTRIRRKVR